jgi:hypothetical protein
MAGILIALFGDGFWHLLSWLLLGAAIGTAAVCVMQAR